MNSENFQSVKSVDFSPKISVIVPVYNANFERIIRDFALRELMSENGLNYLESPITDKVAYYKQP